jgi:hypothetical protein
MKNFGIIYSFFIDELNEFCSPNFPIVGRGGFGGCGCGSFGERCWWM